MDVLWFVFSLLIGSVGFVLFVYGKTQTRFPQMIAGLLMMGYPYFVPDARIMLGIAVVLCGVLWMVVRSGY